MTAPRLSAISLATSVTKVAKPDYARDRQLASVVHLGVGAFHRAHQAWYFDALMAAGEPDWMIRGASVLPDSLAAQLNAQAGLYTTVVREGDEQHARVIGSIRDVLVAPDDPSALIEALADPSIQMVTLTVTEKGYCVDPASSALLEQNPGVQADLKNPRAPSTAPGFLVAGLALRRARGLSPFTVLSCDNIPHNGARTRAAVLGFARRIDPALADWIEARGAFPSCMVDRITPATTAEDVEALAQRFGYRDEAMVKTEPFTQWVVEDTFAARRPALERVGVQMTHDVGPWEKVKLRLLNGSHSALAYLGALAGHAFVHEAMSAPGFERFIEALWDEAQATLQPIDGFDPVRYRAALRRRFLNSALQHRTTQIAMDGSQKLPQRLLHGIRDRRAQQAAAPALTLAVAAWMRWQYGQDESGRSYKVDDPLAERTRALVNGAGGQPEATVRALLSLQPVFGDDLQHDTRLIDALSSALTSMLNHGAAATVRAFARTETT